MQRIRLGRKNIYALVDDDVHRDISMNYILRLNKAVGCLYITAYKKNAGLNVTTPLHRIIMGGKMLSANELVVHKDGDFRNCCRDNLMVMSRSDLMQTHEKNTGYAGKPCTSKYKGVSIFKRDLQYNKRKDHPRYIAHIRIDGVLKHLGLFEKEKDAARAYNKASKKYFGEHATLNKGV